MADVTCWRTLHVRYPAGFPTHSREQVYYFDEQGLLRRLDYMAYALSGFARGAHFCDAHRVFDGLIFPTRRVVFPRGGSGRPVRIVSVMEGWVDDNYSQAHFRFPAVDSSSATSRNRRRLTLLVGPSGSSRSK
jgi:hypothetical protein